MTKTWTLNSLQLQQAMPGSIVVNAFYKAVTDPSYTQFGTNLVVNADGTLAAPPSITIEANTYYSIQVQDLYCNDVYSEMIMFPCASTCPPGWQLSSDGTYCYSQVFTPATPPSGGTASPAVAQSDISYSTCGSYIFNSGYSVNGTGVATQIPTTNAFWVNGSGNCVDNLTTQGPMNRCAIWTSVYEDNQTVGFSTCINVSVATTYYVGCGADNYVIINIDGVNILTQDPTALFGQFPMAGPNAAPFKVWFIYPVTIEPGSHVLETIGFNVSSVAGFGVEIYQNTAAEIALASSYSGLNLIFSTKNVVGQPIQIGSGGLGYTCPVGYSLQPCNSPIQCVQQVTQEPTC
jgi:hypothetical protein